MSLASDSCSTLRRMTTVNLLKPSRSWMFLALALGVVACKPPTEGNDDIGDTGTDTGTDTGESTTTTSTTETTTDTTETTTDTGPVCGDGVVEGDEACDGADLAGQDCVSQGFFGGELACNADCTFDAAACQVDPICGNGVVEGDEVCDTEDFAGETCENLGDFIGGALACNDTCDAIGTLACLSPGEGGACDFDADCPPEAAKCVNNTCWNGSETDPCDFGADCQVSCVNDQCWDGSEGDPCASDNNCSEMAPFCDNVSMMCHDGSLGDPCEFDTECMDGTFCVLLQCYAGAEGDPCEFANDCDPGHVCVPSDGVPGCNEQQPECCTTFCDLTQPNLCPPQTACVPFFGDNPPPPGFEDVGVCFES